MEMGRRRNKSKLNNLREELLNKEIDLYKVGNKLVLYGYEDIFYWDKYMIEEAIKDNKIVIAVQDDWEEHIVIDFKVTSKANIEEESITNTGIYITAIEVK